jgi:DNA-binding MarR family transcriptional regulator
MVIKLNDLLPYKIKVLDSLIRKKSIIMLKPYGVAPEQYGILKLIKEGATSLKASDLAELAGKDKSTITRMINSLHSKSLITKTISKKDKRISIVSLTDSGKRLLKEIDEYVCQNFEDSQSLHNANELEIFNRVLDEIIKNLQGELL